MVAVLPIHTLFLEAWVAWKPFLVVVAVLALGDLVDGIRAKTWPWHRKVSLALVVFGVVVLVGWPQGAYLERFLRLGLGLVVGGLVLLVTERRLRAPGMLDRTLGVVFWSASAMGVTAVAVELVLVGVMGGTGVHGDIPQ